MSGTGGNTLQSEQPSTDTRCPYLVVLLGTRAQLIKMAPVMRELETRNQPYRLVLTGQHTVTMTSLLADFRIATTPEYVHSGREVSGISGMLWWMPKVLLSLLKRRRSLFRDTHGRKATVIVHGDTFSTLIGALAAKLTGCRVAHVESGLRSFSIRNPFPEEITRLLVFRLTDIAYCPGAWAVQNLAGYRLETINTKHNTLLDALRFACAAPDGRADADHLENYCVASVHRFENLFLRSRLQWIMRAVERIAEHTDVVFVLHPATRKRLATAGCLDRLQAHPRIHCRERMPYLPFVRLLRGAEFVITDGGSNQEELSYLGKPTLLLRAATERREGLDANTVLCGYRDDTLETFLRELAPRSDATEILHGDAQPCARIAEHLCTPERPT